MPDDPFFSLRDRAYDLADSGRYKTWAQVASKLKGEGFTAILLERLSADRLAVMMIGRCCDQARASA